MATIVERVDEPVDQRHLRTDDGELDALALDGRQQPFDVVGGDVEQAGVLRDAGVARRAQQLGLLRRAAERAHERVLAAAGADDEDLH